jgi:hypothetical protein
MRSVIERSLIVEGRDLPPEELRFRADHLLTTIVGIATQSIFDPAQWHADRQRRHLRAELAALERPLI